MKPITKNHLGRSLHTIIQGMDTWQERQASDDYK
jgi:hypothetical protein